MNWLRPLTPSGEGPRRSSRSHAEAWVAVYLISREASPEGFALARSHGCSVAPVAEAPQRRSFDGLVRALIHGAIATAVLVILLGCVGAPRSQVQNSQLAGPSDSRADTIVRSANKSHASVFLFECGTRPRARRVSRRETCTTAVKERPRRMAASRSPLAAPSRLGARSRDSRTRSRDATTTVVEPPRRPSQAHRGAPDGESC
jgi:hypothetical protein